MLSQQQSRVMAASSTSALFASAPTIRNRYDKIRTLNGSTSRTRHQIIDLAERHFFVLKSVRNPKLLNGWPVEGRMLEELLSRPEHPNIIPYLEHRISLADGGIVAQYLMPFHQRDQLLQFLARSSVRRNLVPELMIWKLYLQLTSAVAFLHQCFAEPESMSCPGKRGIVHRAIKPSNILFRTPAQRPEVPAATLTFSTTSSDLLALAVFFSYPDIVLCDFGSATFEHTSTFLEERVAHRSPELPLYTPQSEIWSIGSVIHGAIHFKPPIKDYEPQLQNEPREGHYSRHLGQALRLALQREPSERPQASELEAVVKDGLREYLWDLMREQSVLFVGTGNRLPMAEYLGQALPDLFTHPICG